MATPATTRTPQRLAITMGDVAGVGPELVARVLKHSQDEYQPVVFGNPDVLSRAIRLVGAELKFETVSRCSDISGSEVVCVDTSDVDCSAVVPCTVDPVAGKAAYQWLVAAIDSAINGDVCAIVTAPLNKAALSAAGVEHPGHTEILAERCRVEDFAMMLYLQQNAKVAGPHGISINHVTLHTSIASVPSLLNVERIAGKIRLMDRFLRQIGVEQPRVAVCALNPHAGEGGLFGREEAELITPAIERTRAEGLSVSDAAPADTLIMRAVAGEFDGVVAMYHDQGHIAMKLLGFNEAVNVTLGLPIVRTSPAQGTAFDIAWKGIANPTGMRSAVDVALRLAK